jgi:hypothetical protein
MPIASDPDEDETAPIQQLMNPEPNPRDNFLKVISQIESSGGQNTNHPVSTAPIQAGQHAFGQYGLMPNTVDEMMKRSGTRGPASIVPGSQAEDQMAAQLADRVLNRFQDPNMAAYAWNHGHNLTPDQVKARDYMNDPYVQKFQKIRQKLGY